VGLANFFSGSYYTRGVLPPSVSTGRRITWCKLGLTSQMRRHMGCLRQSRSRLTTYAGRPVFSGSWCCVIGSVRQPIPTNPNQSQHTISLHTIASTSVSTSAPHRKHNRLRYVCAGMPAYFQFRLAMLAVASPDVVVIAVAISTTFSKMLVNFMCGLPPNTVYTEWWKYTGGCPSTLSSCLPTLHDPTLST
jgi:hypothetical protein